MTLPPRLRRPFAAVAAAAALLVWSCAVAVAAVEDGFAVSSIAVDVTSQSATDARTRAFAEAQARGLARLFDRLVPAPARASAPSAAQLGQAGLDNLVADVAVDEEKGSAVRYIARLTVHFKPAAVRALLRQHNLPFVEPAVRPVLVVPVFQAAAEAPAHLWEDGNPWRAAWQRRAGTGALVPVALPGADAQATLSAAQAVASEAEALERLRQQSVRAESVIVAHAAMTPAQPPVVDIRVVRPGEVNPAMTQQVAGERNETTEAVLDKAAAAVVAFLENEWRAGTVVGAPGVAPARLTALVPVASIDEWLAVRRALAKVRLVSRVRVQALRRDMAQIVIDYAGDDSQLVAALAQQDLKLEGFGDVRTIALGRRGL